MKNAALGEWIDLGSAPEYSTSSSSLKTALPVEWTANYTFILEGIGEKMTYNFTEEYDIIAPVRTR